MVISRQTLDIITELLRKELRVRYKHMALGYLWSIFSPLCYAGLYYFVFKIVMKVQTPNYPLFLIGSLFPWQWLSNSISVGSMTFLGNAALIKKTNFPRYLISFVAVLQDLVHFLFSLPVILLFCFIFSVYPTIHWLYGVPLLLFVHFILAYSFNLFIASVNLFFRDMERIIQLFMTFLFYATPVLYAENLIPEEYRSLIIYHPIAMLIINWRNVFLGLNFNWYYYSLTFIWTIGLLIISQFIYKRLVWRFAEVL